MATDFTLENLSKSLDDSEFDTQNLDDDNTRTPLEHRLAQRLYSTHR